MTIENNSQKMKIMLRIEPWFVLRFMQESEYDYEQTPINEIVNKGYVTKQMANSLIFDISTYYIIWVKFWVFFFKYFC